MTDFVLVGARAGIRCQVADTKRCHVPRRQLPALASGILLGRLDSNRDFSRDLSVSCRETNVGPGAVHARTALRRGPSYDRITGRIPVAVDAEICWRFSAENRGSSK